ncbi:MAG: glycosyltransferase family 2 protein [Anaerolineales bacterium]|nr:glycosyltransferase family 2 protein [Anaerolineales bacterium]
MVDLSIVIVSWNVWPQLQACLASIERASHPAPTDAQARLFGPGATPRTLEVVVVDNDSQDDTAHQLPQHFPWVRLLVADTNLGFTRGNNVGYAASTGRIVFFLNPDTELDVGQSANADSLWRLATAIENASTVGVIGPQLRYADGSPQPSVRRFPTRLTGFFESTWLGRAWPTNPWSQRMHWADWQVHFEHDVDWIVGAAMFCRRATLEQTRTPAGPFDERFFMYSEELDLCMRSRPPAGASCTSRTLSSCTTRARAATRSALRATSTSTPAKCATTISGSLPPGPHSCATTFCSNFVSNYGRSSSSSGWVTNPPSAATALQLTKQ